MTRDNIVYTICGLALGLIIGSFLIGPHLAKVPQLASQPQAQADAQPQAPANQNQMAAVRQQLDELKKKIADNPNDFDSIVQLGNMYADVAKYPQAIDYYEQALRVREDPNVRTDLGISYKETGRLDDAHTQFEKIVSESPDSWQALYNLIIIDGQMKKFDEARSELVKLKQLRPNDPEVAKLEEALSAQR